ncbi:hypothetical protein [uncultured Nocardioides sp.]|uniref:hypothetical protein n=1 Tax=uncultured Nocardioides sp. TaxID=198441 RepID=UPI002610E5E0|nr:hypothetical protein [uncultured Nocardioides sp.]
MSISDDTTTTGVGSDPPVETGLLAVHRFARPAGIRRLQAVTVACTVVLTAFLGLWARLDERALAGLPILLLGLTVALTLVWFGKPPSDVRVEYGTLVVTTGDRELRLDVAGVELDVVGSPGQRGWRVRFRRPGRRSLVIDSSMVDPLEFTQVMGRWRPDLVRPDLP